MNYLNDSPVMPMRIAIIKPGLLSTVQDMGRWQHLSQGVPRSGAMDALSARIANLAVGNTIDKAVIEFTYADALFRSEDDLLLAYSGDGAVLKAGSYVLPSDRPVYVPFGTEICLAPNASGCRTYLAVAGGWDVAEVLGSRSTYITAAFGGYEGRALRPGDLLHAADNHTAITAAWCRHLWGRAIRYPPWAIARGHFLPPNRYSIRVVPAREFAWFVGKSVVDLLSAPFTVSTRCNRMGYHLEGPALHRTVDRELISTAVVPGTVQVTGDGNPLLLMADCQTTGGYPRIAQVATVDMPLCAQLKPGDMIFFNEISRSEAEKLYLHRENQLNRLAASLAMHTPTM
ncbi:biotin-dependent carboxyltransferase family protein [Parapedobacter sp. 2B3]|uniref:5-oxoprolinase subunit C family protein n=1 Tax=Parapedobacter sp. 2B3 TaxID=3342381 RepID=UPI0035B6812E